MQPRFDFEAADRAKREGMVTPTETYRLSSRVSAHRNPRRVWRSMLCN